MTKPAIRWTHWAKHRMYETALAGLVVFLFSSFASEVKEGGGRVLSADSWLQIHEVFIPNHSEGSNPDVTFDRTILAPFTGFFIAEVQSRQPNGLWANQCSGSSARGYVRGEVIPGRALPWSMFLNRECPVPSGIYRVRVSFDIKPENVETKMVVFMSNEFRVTP